jgi:transposase
MTQAILQGDDNANRSKIYVAFELSATKWKLALSPGDQRYREVTVEAGDLEGVERAVRDAKKRYELEESAVVVSCYEAGRDGFWIHRALEERRWLNVIIDAASMDVDRRARRVKTDRIDLRRLMSCLIRHDRGEENVWSVLRIPSPEDEDARRLHREIARLKKERTMHVNRIRALLALHGVRDVSFNARFAEELGSMRTPDGKTLPTALMQEILREQQRVLLVREQIKLLDKQRHNELVEAATKMPEAQSPAKTTSGKALTLGRLQGIGINCSWLLAHELFGWRTFSNRREIAGAVGLTPTPYQSGNSDRDQGISKAGNPRVRAMLIEIAWGWLRFQPSSELTQWFQQKFGHGNGRMKRIGIVALARRLLIALWRFVEDGVVPKGALLKIKTGSEKAEVAS